MSERINLIVHEEMIRCYNERHSAREVKPWERVLDRIEMAKSGEFGKSVNFEGYHFERVVEFCEGASEVRVFGGFRGACLDFVYAPLEKAGISCVFDLEGTV